MLQNVGSADRVIRIVADAAMIGAKLMGVIGPSGWTGVVPLATGLFRCCPEYLTCGLGTCAGKSPAVQR
ncbi:MAG: DUF2892 domain-containing protein [Rhodoferax sp.]|nr:DUF2892 domain-containing protein [Rhodoferax sp.]